MNNVGSVIQHALHGPPTVTTIRLDKSAFYAPVPMLVLGSSVRGDATDDSHNGELLIHDFNAAMGVLMGEKLTRCRGCKVRQFLDTISSQVSGSLIPAPHEHVLELPGGALIGSELPHCLNASGDTVEFRSHEFGATMLRCTTVGLLDEGRIDIIGATVYMEIQSIERQSKFLLKVDEENTQQLIWEEYAVSYDLILPQMAYYQEVIRRHVTALTNAAVRKVIDIGAGTGNVAIKLLRAGVDVTAIDNSRAMLDRFGAKLRDLTTNSTRPSAHVTPQTEVSPRRLKRTGEAALFEQNAESLSQFKEESFDGVNVLLALFDMGHPEAAFSEALRVLKPGGIIIVTEPKEQFQIDVILESILDFLNAQPFKTPEEAARFDELWRGYYHLVLVNRKIDPATRESGSPLRAEKVCSMLQDRQFQAITMRDSHFNQCATVCGIKPGGPLPEGA